TIQSRAKERPHPATFPVQLAEWCIKLHGVSRIGTMLDPFLGIGNSAVAAQRCGVKQFIGLEIDETYLAEAKRRLGIARSQYMIILFRGVRLLLKFFERFYQIYRKWVHTIIYV